MYNFTREIINSRRENIWVIICFLGGQWVFWGASGFSDSLAPWASGCHSPMSRPDTYVVGYLLSNVSEVNFVDYNIIAHYVVYVILSSDRFCIIRRFHMCVKLAVSQLGYSSNFTTYFVMSRIRVGDL